MLPDLRFALRQLTKAPGFTALVILTLALGIGANTTIFSLVHATFLRALPYPAPDQLVHLSEKNAHTDDLGVSYPNFVDWRAAQTAFSAIAIFRTDGRKLRTPDSTEQVTIAQVSGEFFPAVGVHAAQGRDLTPEDDRVGAAPVLWLTHAAWQHYFRGAPDLIGQTLLLDGQPTRVAGILPAHFHFHRAADVFVPIDPYVDGQFMRERANRSGTSVIARLKPGGTFAAARAQMQAIGQRLAQEHPAENTGIDVSMTTLRARLAGDSRTRLLLLLGAVGVVLLIACVNVASMLLARSFGRAREIAIRTALGATRADVIRQLLTESLLLALGGGIVGVAGGVWGHDLVRRLMPWEIRQLMEGTAGLDLGVLLFIAFLVLVTGMAFGFAPAWQLSHANPNDALKNTQPTRRTFVGRIHLADGLVVVQVALAVMLLVAAGLLIRSFARLAAVDSGIRPDHVLTLRVATPPQEVYLRDPLGYVHYHERILAKVQSLGEVQSAAFVSSLPFTWNTSNSTFFLPDRPPPAPGQSPSASVHVVTPDYFQTLGIRLLRGRTFDGREPSPTMPAGEVLSMALLPKIYAGLEVSLVISQSLADQQWPGENPVGRRIQFGTPEMHLPTARVIGVVGNTTQLGAERGPSTEYYCLLKQWPAPMSLYLVVRTGGEPAPVLAAVRAAVRSVVPDEPVFDVALMTERVTNFSSERRFNMGLFSVFAATALLLATIGIYGVLACVIGQHTRDIGIRMALGAQRSGVLRDVLGRGLKLAVPGVCLGLAGAWAGSRLLASQLYGISGNDLPTYLGGAILLLLAALLACWVPARRATRVDPLIALRAE